jgi:hypothetical protein
MSWHADAALLERYTEGTIDDAHASSLEAHLLACETCRSGVAAFGDVPRLERVWAGVDEAIDAPETGVVERTLVRLGVREHVARLLAATPSLRLSWLSAEALALGFALLAANAATTAVGRELSTFLFLVVAAVLPLGGVAVAYGPEFDPTHEIGLAAPMRSFRLLLIRAAAVLGTSTIVTAIAALALPSLDWRAAAWTLPSVALVLGSLALATRLRPTIASGAVVFLWVAIAIVAAYHRTDRFVIFRGGGQAVFLAVIALSALVLARRRDAFERGGTA